VSTEEVGKDDLHQGCGGAGCEVHEVLMQIWPHFPLPVMPLSEPHALQPAILPIPNRVAGPPPGSILLLVSSPRVPSSQSGRGPRGSLNAPENLPKESRRQGALRLADEPPAGLEPPLLQARQRPALDGERQDQPTQEIAEVIGDDAE